MNKLEVRDLSAAYINVNGREVLRDVTFTLDAGEALLINGHNGSGKSTLLKVLAGLISATAGLISWSGCVVGQVRPEGPTHPWVGMQMQAENVFAGLTVRCNVELAMKRSNSKTTYSHDRVLDDFPILSPLWNKRAGLLSGGQRKILALAMATLGDAPLLLLDEPLAGLSGENVSLVLACLRARKQAGAAMIIVEHSATKLGNELIDLRAEMIEGRLPPPCRLTAKEV